MPMPQTVVEQLPMEMKGNNLVSRRLHSKEISKEQGRRNIFSRITRFWPFIIPPYPSISCFFKDWLGVQICSDVTSIQGLDSWDEANGSLWFLAGWITLNRSHTDVSGMWYLFLATMVVIPVGYGSIPMKIPFLGEWTSINPSYFDVNYRGTRFWHTASSASHLSKAIKTEWMFFLRCLLRCGTPTSAGFLEDWTTGWHRDLKKSDHTTFKKKSGKVMVMSLVVKWFQLQLGLFTFYLVLFNT